CDVVADLDVGYFGAGRVHDARRVRSADVEVGRLAEARVHLGDVDGDAARCPYVVVVDAGGHHEDERVVRADLGNVDLFDLERLLRLPEALRTDHLCVHARGDLADRWELADLVDGCRHQSFSRRGRSSINARRAAVEPS